MAGSDDPAARIRELETEVEHLRSWKEEALPVIFGLQDLGRALDMRLGTTITGPTALEAVAKLKAERDTARDDERQAWASWLDNWMSAVGPAMPTVDAVARALREGPRPFGTSQAASR